MIWTDVGTFPKIEKASLSGNQRVTIVTTHLYLPKSIDLDQGNKRIFWVDALSGRVETVDYNGNNRKILLQIPLLHPYGVVLVAPSCFLPIGLHIMRFTNLMRPVEKCFAAIAQTVEHPWAS